MGICRKSFGVRGTAVNFSGTHGGRGVRVMLGALVYFPIDLGARGKTLDGRARHVRRIKEL
jgi:hypothetical protein